VRIEEQRKYITDAIKKINIDQYPYWEEPGNEDKNRKE
jgi:hypothetical protein